MIASKNVSFENTNTKDLITLYRKDQQRQQHCTNNKSTNNGDTDLNDDLDDDDERKVEYDNDSTSSQNEGSSMIKKKGRNHDNSASAPSFPNDDSEPAHVGSESIPFNDDDHDDDDDDDDDENRMNRCCIVCYRDSNGSLRIKRRIPTLRDLALLLSLYVNLLITFAKLVTYIRTLSLSVLAALLDSVLDVVSQLVLNYTEKHSSLQRSSAVYPAGASRLEPIGVLTCAALMGMASFEVIRQSIVQVASHDNQSFDVHNTKAIMNSFIIMASIVVVKLLLLWLCRIGAKKHQPTMMRTMKVSPDHLANRGEHNDNDHDIETQHHTSEKNNAELPKYHSILRENHHHHHFQRRDETEVDSNTTPTYAPTILATTTTHQREEEEKDGTERLVDDDDDIEKGDNPTMITSIVSSDPKSTSLTPDDDNNEKQDDSFETNNSLHGQSHTENEPLLCHHPVPHHSNGINEMEVVSNTTSTIAPAILSSQINKGEEESLMTSVEEGTENATKKVTTTSLANDGREITMNDDDDDNMEGGNPTMMTSIGSSDPTLEALAQDHLNDCLSNTVAAIALFGILYSDNRLWYLDPLGAMIISVYIIYSWYITGKEQIAQLTGKSAPDDFIDEIRELATNFDPNQRIVVDVIRAYHFGPKFLVEIEIVMPKTTYLYESHDVGMELQYEIESLPNVERCFVHIDYETRPYDEHVVSKVPELLEKYRPAASTTGSLTEISSGHHPMYRSSQSV